MYEWVLLSNTSLELQRRLEENQNLNKPTWREDHGRAAPRWKDGKQWGKGIITPRWWRLFHFLVEDWYAGHLGLRRWRGRGYGGTNWDDLLIGCIFASLSFAPSLSEAATGRLLDSSTDGKQLSDSQPPSPPAPPLLPPAPPPAAHHMKKKRDFSQDMKTVEVTSAERKQGLEDWAHSVRVCLHMLTDWLTDWLIIEYKSNRSQVTHLFLLSCEVWESPKNLKPWNTSHCVVKDFIFLAMLKEINQVPQTKVPKSDADYEV